MGLLVLAAAIAAAGLLALRLRKRWWTAAFALLLVAEFTLAVEQWTPPTVAATTTPTGTATEAQVLALVRASNAITAVPSDIDVPPRSVRVMGGVDWGGVPGLRCFASYITHTLPPCEYGDTAAARTIVLYGDSHVQMWFQAIDAIATRDHWKLVILSKEGCPAASLAGRVAPASATPEADRTCRIWHTYVAARINKMYPEVLVLSQDVYRRPNGVRYTPQQWQRALAAKIHQLHAGRVVVLGNTPTSFGPECLLRRSVRDCSVRPDGIAAPYRMAERAAAESTGARYVDVTPWFCAALCSPIIGRFDVYFDNNHIARGYSEYLEGVLGHALTI